MNEFPKYESWSLGRGFTELGRTQAGSFSVFTFMFLEYTSNRTQNCKKNEWVQHLEYDVGGGRLKPWNKFHCIKCMG